MNLELVILKSLFLYEDFMKYGKMLSSRFLETNHKELWKLYQTVVLWHESFPNKNINSVEDLEVFFYVNFPATPKKEKDVFTAIFQKLNSVVTDREILGQLLTQLSQRAKAAELTALSIDVADGKVAYEKLLEAAAGLGDVSQVEEDDSEFVTDDLEDIFDHHYREGGFRWRLKALNKMLGPLRIGDFGFIFARPETGKTTILASEITYFATQTEKPIIWFNNEQPGEIVKTRVIQAYFGITTQELFKNAKTYRDKYLQELGGRIKVYDSGSISKRDVDRIAAKYNPALMVFDQIDKLKGFENDRYDLELKEVYQWVRELAKQYGPTIGVCQAGGSGEGKKYLTMDDVDSSKTAKQGEADWILGIGKSHQEGMESVRHFHLCKNKLIGGEDSIPELRHGKYDVLIKPEIARYVDIE